MKMMKYMTSIATALFALVACSDADDILSAYHNDPNAVHINAEVRLLPMASLAVIHSEKMPMSR